MLESLWKQVVPGTIPPARTGGVRGEHLLVGTLVRRVQHKMDDWTRRALQFLLRENGIVLIQQTVFAGHGSSSFLTPPQKGPDRLNSILLRCQVKLQLGLSLTQSWMTVFIEHVPSVLLL